MAYYFLKVFPDKPLPLQAEKIFVISKGASVQEIMRELVREQVLSKRQAQLFLWWIRWRQAQTQIQAGEYALSLPSTPRSLLAKWVKGEQIIRSVIFVEGITFAQVLEQLERSPFVQHTLQGKTSEEIMSLLGGSGSPEGLFFPDTYYFKAGIGDITLLRMAYRKMQTVLAQLWEGRENPLPLQSPYEALILASILEKETTFPEERAMMSGVFCRRLWKKIPLQADPTVYYGVPGTRELTRALLKQDTPYNTYVRKGLPPTPIALPSWSAIYAALHPLPGDTLYFVSRGDGTHHFSRTLEEHLEAIRKYRRDLPKKPGEVPHP